jgi:hypothetical protein
MSTMMSIMATQQDIAKVKQRSLEQSVLLERTCVMLILSYGRPNAFAERTRRHSLG